MFSFGSDQQSSPVPNQKTATPAQVQLRNNIVDKLSLSFTPQRPKPSRLASAPTVMASKKLHKFGNKCVLNSRGTFFDVESQPRPSSNDEKPEPRTIHIQNPRLLPAFLHSEKKNRRKMVMGPMSCEMFWDEQFKSPDVCFTQDTITIPSSLINESKEASISMGSVKPVESGKPFVPQRPVRPALFSMNSMGSTFSEPHGSSSATPLTTPGSRGTETRTHMASGYTPSGLKNSSVLLTPRAYLRPKILRFGSLPMIANQPSLNSTPQSEGRRPRPLLTLQPRRTTFSGMRSELPCLDLLQSRDGSSTDPTCNYPNPSDTPRFGLALMNALNIALDDMDRQACHKQEEIEMEQLSYWSASETEEEADEDSCHNGDLLDSESYHSSL